MASGAYPRGRVTAKHAEIRTNLARWAARLAAGPPTRVKDGEFWLGGGGTILRATRSARRTDTTVRAEVYIQEPGVGRIAPTGETRGLSALRAGGTRCHVATLVASDSEGEDDGEDDSMSVGEATEYDGGGTPKDLGEAIGRVYRHALLAPAGMAPTPDARVLAWKRPETTTEAKQVSLEGARTRDVRDTYAALEWDSPRVFTTGGRYEYMLAGLSEEGKRRRIRSIATGMRHPAIPQQESHHLCITMHHGHWQGGQKCKGEEALCAHCLRAGTRVEETSTHAHHECGVAKAVWQEVAERWKQATGEELDVTEPLLTVAGLRTPPADLGDTGSQEAMKKWRAGEPGWRLLHSVTLLQLHQARCRSHAAYHAKERRTPKKTSAKCILTEVRRRVQDRLEFEYRKAQHAEENARQRGARSAFFNQWVDTGLAEVRKQGPRLSLFSKPRPEADGEPAKGTIHVRTAAALLRSTATQGPAAGWSVSVHEVQGDGTEKLRLRASGAVPARSTHGAKAPPQAPDRHTQQAAHQAAAAAALVYARQIRRRERSRVLITASSDTTHRNLMEKGEAQDAPARPETRGQKASRAAGNRAADMKRRREEKGGADAYREASQLTQNKNQLRSLEFQEPGMVRIRAPKGAQNMTLYAAAVKAARMRDLKAHVVTAEGKHRALALWEDARTWDPGD